MTTELLWLHPSGISDQQCSVVCNELLLQLHSAESIDVLGVVGNEGLGDSLTDSINLRGVPSTFHSDADIKGSEGFFTSNKDGLVNLKTEDFRLNEVDRGAVNTDKSATFAGVGDSSRGLMNQYINMASSSFFGLCDVLSFCRTSGRP